MSNASGDRESGGLDLDTLLRGGFALLGFGLFLIGIQHLTSNASGASVCFGFGFLLFVLATVSKFKKFKGFGFEAETWEQTQQQAEHVIHELRDTGADLARNFGVLSARVGGDAAPTTEERYQLFGVVKDLLSKSQKDAPQNAAVLKDMAKSIVSSASQEIKKLNEGIGGNDKKSFNLDKKAGYKSFSAMEKVELSDLDRSSGKKTPAAEVDADATQQERDRLRKRLEEIEAIKADLSLYV